MSIVKGMLKMANLDAEKMEFATAFLEGGPGEKRQLFSAIIDKMISMGRELFKMNPAVVAEEGEDPVFQVMIMEHPNGTRYVAAVFMKEATIRVAASFTVPEIMQQVPDEKLPSMK